MVFEQILSPRLLRTKPHYAMAAGFFFVMMGYLSSLFIFSSEISIVMVAMASLFMLPYAVKIFEFEELHIDLEDTAPGELDKWVKKCLRDGFSPQQIKDNFIRDNLDKTSDLIEYFGIVDENYINHMSSSNIISRHRQTILFYAFLFFGSTLAFMLLYGSLSQESVTMVFEKQSQLIRPANSVIEWSFSDLSLIVVNNSKIVLICALLSLFYGSGALFILNYNASIAGVMYGGFIRAWLWGTEHSYSNLLIFLPHTTLEILGYLLAAIAGGILSKATMGRQQGSVSIWLRDGLILLGLSFILIFIAGFVEIGVLNQGY